jgi:hypothetical protein
MIEGLHPPEMLRPLIDDCAEAIDCDAVSVTISGVISPDDRDFITVAVRLGKSLRWLQARFRGKSSATTSRIACAVLSLRRESPRWDDRHYRQPRLALFVEAETRRWLG